VAVATDLTSDASDLTSVVPALTASAELPLDAVDLVAAAVVGSGYLRSAVVCFAAACAFVRESIRRMKCSCRPSIGFSSSLVAGAVAVVVMEFEGGVTTVLCSADACRVEEARKLRGAGVTMALGAPTGVAAVVVVVIAVTAAVAADGGVAGTNGDAAVRRGDVRAATVVAGAAVGVGCVRCLGLRRGLTVRHPSDCPVRSADACGVEEARTPIVLDDDDGRGELEVAAAAAIVAAAAYDGRPLQ